MACAGCRMDARRAWERSFRGRGSRLLTIRLSPAATRALETLQAEQVCCPRDAIEALLLHNVRHDPVVLAMREHGLSREEAVAFVALERA